MGAKRGLLRGHKISNKHGSVISHAEIVIKTAKRRPEVSKIILGTIRTAKSGSPNIKFVPIRAGLRINVRGKMANQILFVYTSNSIATEKAIRQMWNRAHK